VAVLQVSNATKNFGKKKVLTNVSLSIETGTVVGLFGSNGSGKSTLLKMIIGTLRATSLRLEINGISVRPSLVISQRSIAYVPQHPFLPQRIKVRDIIPIYASSEEAQDAIFYHPQIARIAQKSIGELSHGERKFFETVLVASGPHPFLMLDEPFSLLDPLQIEALKDFLKALKPHKGILLTDHYYGDVLAISDQKIVLAAGTSHIITSEAQLKNFEYLRGDPSCT
jgi:ABC-type multidrug transport system ATPase subunit